MVVSPHGRATLARQGSAFSCLHDRGAVRKSKTKVGKMGKLGKMSEDGKTPSDNILQHPPPPLAVKDEYKARAPHTASCALSRLALLDSVPRTFFVNMAGRRQER